MSERADVARGLARSSAHTLLLAGGLAEWERASQTSLAREVTSFFMQSRPGPGLQIACVSLAFPVPEVTVHTIEQSQLVCTSVFDLNDRIANDIRESIWHDRKTGLTMAREGTPTIVERLENFMENETGPGKLVTYGIASAGLLVALYRIRPSRVPLQGTVMRVEPSNGVLLMVNHESLLPFPHFNSKSYLPVKLSGVDVTSNGISWLQSIINGNRVTFVPLAKENNYLECIVTMPQHDQDSLRVGEELVKLGLGTICESRTGVKDKHVLLYKQSLASAQKWARFSRNGHWHFVKQPTYWWKMQIFIINKMKSLLPTYIAKQLNL
ncbi:uncharacterized protein LOC105282392 isoform X2 [Ooceraea biroi]|uniref:uncharacterized protein LOC105282392 isoform X2 n=1 Tax=Ooceraea biroi TaxID=2015173 RepID=UPI0009716D86|nr:uncharacterized protein LOC105282392 isoform X2 [Ooceraea biroi]